MLDKFVSSYLDELLLDDSRVKAIDFFDAISNVGRNPNGRHIVWTFVRDKWEPIVSK